MDIAFDEQELAVKYDEDIDDTLSWEKVIRISGYKVYAYPGEATFLVFETADGDTLEVSDEMSGWLELLGGLHNIFKLNPGWEEELADIEPGGEDVVFYATRTAD
ncbi:hypothetical protein ACTJJ0_20735 [Chitinophaga sp. 22321]|uniref:Immunity protein 53 n=1 Tax=Chitinophaga hostae TaxID=2831022 RepID=A0ABS5J5R1_9BACT|nr:hypothetical protein [Chitinophaga hostae]MBS0029912.1 hypothetical protein [Chitinophaga hostae]